MTDILPCCLATSRQHPSHITPLQPGEPSPDQYYPSSATAHLNAVFGREAKSPRNPYSGNSAGLQSGGRGPVPKFKFVKSGQDIEPRINPQPAFRRADPEGGFISVSGG